jgi:hypothetical protein
MARTGLLADRRTTEPHGLDAVLCAGVGVNLREVHGLLNSLPTYAACEDWIRANARSVDPGALARINATVLDVHDSPAIWETFHAWLMANKNEPHDPIVPAISARSTGPLGLGHLARLWVKHLLDAVDLLPVGYTAGRYGISADAHGWRNRVPAGTTFDLTFFEEFGVDPDACAAYVKSSWPSYADFERWFVVNATKFGEKRVAPFNATLGERSLGDDMRDWERLHAIALSTGVRPSGGATGGRRR